MPSKQTLPAKAHRLSELLPRWDPQKESLLQLSMRRQPIIDNFLRMWATGKWHVLGRTNPLQEHELISPPLADILHPGGEIDFLGDRLRRSPYSSTFYDVMVVIPGEEGDSIRAQNGGTVAAENRCRAKLERLMAGGGKPIKTKTEYRNEMCAEFGVSIRAFDRVWHEAAVVAGNSLWCRPGRKS